MRLVAFRTITIVYEDRLSEACPGLALATALLS